MSDKPIYTVDDFPELRAINRTDAERVLNESIAAMKRADEDALYGNVMTGRGVLKIFAIAMVLSVLVLTYYVVPPILNIELSFLKYAAPAIALLVLFYFNTRGRRRLRPYIRSALNNRTSASRPKS